MTPPRTTTDLPLHLRRSPWMLALGLGLVSACQPEPSRQSPDGDENDDARTHDGSDADDGTSASTDWTVVSEFRTVCRPSEPCVRSIEVNSVGEITLTDPVGTLDLAPHLDRALIDRWAAFAQAMEVDSCPWDRPTDSLDTVNLVVTRAGTVVVVETAMGCVDRVPAGADETLGTLLHDSLEGVQPDIGCPEWVAGPVDFDGMQLLEDTPRFACMPRF